MCHIVLPQTCCVLIWPLICIRLKIQAQIQHTAQTCKALNKLLLVKYGQNIVATQ